MPVLAERGYLIPATDSDVTDYLSCAIQLAHSIRQWHPDADISVMTMGQCNDPVFDRVISLPHGDQSGFANDWQCFRASPYRQTIKLEADMICASAVDHWWTMFEHRDLVISQGCRDYYDRPATSRQHRKIFDDNLLPDVYNAITYWKLSNTAQEFFKLTRSIFQNWDQFKTLLKFPDEVPTTDVVYAMAAVIMGVDQVTLPQGCGPTIVHMKRHIIGTKSHNWSHELVWENADPGLRINTVAQWGLVHYHNKEWRMG